MSYTRDLGGAQKPHLAIVEFFIQAEQNNFKSEQEGRPVFDDKEFIRINTPGDKNSEVVERVKDHHRQTYQRQYEAFKAGETLAVEGYPLKEWPQLSPAMVANLRALSIVTVEQLAALDDGKLDNLGMGGRTLRDKARLWLEQASGGAPLSRLQQENDNLRADMEVLKKTVAEQAAAIARIRPVSEIGFRPGPLFFEQDGVIMFQIGLDASSIIGPNPMRAKDRHDYLEAWFRFCDDNPEWDVGTGARKAAPTRDLAELRAPETEAEERDRIRAHLERLNAPKPHPRTGIEKLRAALAEAQA